MKQSLLKHIVCPALAIATLSLAGCKSDSTAKAELGKPKPSAQATTKEDVATTVAVEIKLPQTVWLAGSLSADEQSDVAAKRGGIVQEVLIDRGSIIKKGDVMVRLDPTDANNSLKQSEAAAAELLVRLGLSSADEKFSLEKQPDVKVAKSALELAQRNFDRDKKLNESKIISPEEYDKTQNAYLTARQNYELAIIQANQTYQSFQTALTRVRSARQLVEDMTIKAPFDGAVVEKLVAPGEALTDSARVANLVRINPLRLLLSVPEQEVGKITQGQKVHFNVDSYPGEKFEGVIKNISPALNADTRTLTVEAMVPNNNQELRPGLFATAELELDAERTGVRVPASAVRRRDEVAQVFVVDEGIARATMVVAGEVRRGFVEITAGLKGGEQIVANATQVEDGVRIQ